jgi:hypothetical protein
MATFLKFLVIVIVSALIDGIVVSKMWLWFLVPLGVHAISVAHAFGLSCIVNVLVYRPDLKTEGELGERVINCTLFALFTFGMAWVAHLCM